MAGGWQSAADDARDRIAAIATILVDFIGKPIARISPALSRTRRSMRWSTGRLSETLRGQITYYS
jgi:hypothetical protein